MLLLLSLLMVLVLVLVVDEGAAAPVQLLWALRRGGVTAARRRRPGPQAAAAAVRDSYLVPLTCCLLYVNVMGDDSLFMTASRHFYCFLKHYTLGDSCTDEGIMLIFRTNVTAAFTEEAALLAKTLVILARSLWRLCIN